VKLPLSPWSHSERFLIFTENIFLVSAVACLKTLQIAGAEKTF
jgi:hypothetical protein